MISTTLLTALLLFLAFKFPNKPLSIGKSTLNIHSKITRLFHPILKTLLKTSSETSFPLSLLKIRKKITLSTIEKILNSLKKKQK